MDPQKRRDLVWQLGHPVAVGLHGVGWLGVLALTTQALLEHWEEQGELIGEPSTEELGAIALTLYRLRAAVRLGAPARFDQSVAALDEQLEEVYRRCAFVPNPVLEQYLPLFVHRFGIVTMIAGPPLAHPPLGGC